MNDQRREILNQVAVGAITAEEGAARLEALEGEPSAVAQPTPLAGQPSAPAAAGAAVRQVRVVTRFGNTEVIGDPTVSYAVAEGPHRARQDGDTMVIDQSLLGGDSGFEFIRPQGRVKIPAFDFGSKLTVRMNPALALSAKVQAGNLSIQGLRGPVTGDIQAGNCSLSDFRGPIQLNVSAGEITARGRLDGGASAIHCKMGDVRVVLEKTSSVRITAQSLMGDVSIAGADATGGHQLTLGSGDGTLDCDCMMGTVRIEVQ